MTRLKHTTYAIAPDGVIGTYPEFPNVGVAFEEALYRVETLGESVTVLRVEGDTDLTFTPLAVVSPPAAKETP